MKRIFHRVISFLLILALLGPLFQPLVLYAEEFSYDLSSDEAADLLEKGSEEFQIYLADFLMQYPKLDSDLEQNMLHRQIYEALCADGKYYKSVEWYQNLTLTGDFDEDKTSLYREMLLEIIQMQLSSKEAQEQLQNRYAFWSETVLENVAIGLDIGPEAVKGGAIYEALYVKSAEEIWDIISKSDLMTKETGYLANSSITEFNYNMAGLKMLVSGAKNGLDYMSKLPVYLALAETRDGMLGTLKLMYRRTQTRGLRTALYQIIESLETEAGNEDLAKIVEHLQFESVATGIMDMGKSFILDALGVAGLIVNVGELFANVKYNANDIGEASLMLEVIVNIEDEVKSTVAYSLNTYRGDYEDAIVLNQSVALLYDVYEYGTDLANTFFEEVYENGTLNKKAKNFETTLYNNMETLSGQKGKESVRTLYPSWVKTYRNIAIVGRSVFASVWQMYQEETGNTGIVMEVDMDSFPVYVDELKTDNEVIVLEKGEHGKVDVTINPANAQNAQLTYESSNESVVTVDANGLLTAKGAGTAVITIATADKAKSVTREVMVEEEEEEATSLDIAINFEWPENYYSLFFEENGDEIILRSFIVITYEECVERNILEQVEKIAVWEKGKGNKKVYAFLPAYINGKPVTSLLLTNDYYAYSINSKAEYSGSSSPQDAIIKYIPTTVKRIGRFQNFTFSNTFVLHEGIEDFGVFRNCTFLGWESEEEKEKKNIENPFFEIPSSVNVIDSFAFSDCKFGYRSIRFNASVEEIPAYCFNGVTEVDTLTFGENTKIKKISQAAFEDSKINNLWLPDTVEEIEDSAMRDCDTIINNLPSNVKEIGRNAFANASFSDSMQEYVFPEEIRIISEGAFKDIKNGMQIIHLPDTLERIGRGAFTYEQLNEVHAYTSTCIDKPEGTIDSFAFEKANYIEIPSNVVSLGGLHVGRELILPAGLKEIEYLQGGSGPWTIRVAEGEAAEKGIIHDWISAYDLQYIELPGAFANLVIENERPFYNDRADKLEIHIKGDKEKVSENWKDIIENRENVGLCALYALDEKGEEVCLYRGPSTYKKFSQRRYEDERDYTIVFPEETQRITNQKIQYAVMANDGTFSMKEMAVRINAEDEIYSEIEDGKVSIQYWSEDSMGSRVAELGSYFDFEDLYLQQEEYAYFNVSVQDENGLEIKSPEGDYQIIMEIPSDWYDFGLYHISESGRITRLKGERIKEGNVCEFRALSEKLGGFAMISFTNTIKEVPTNWLEELHELWGTQKSEVSTEPQQEEVTNGKVSVWVTDDSAEETEVEKSKAQEEVTTNKESTGITTPFEEETGDKESAGTTASSKEETGDEQSKVEKAENKKKVDTSTTSQVTPIQTNDRIWLKDELGIALEENERILEIRTTKEDAQLAIHVEAEEEIKPILVYVDEEKGKLEVQKLRIDHVLTEEEQVLTDKGIVLPDGTVATEEELQGTTLLEEIKAAESARMKEEVRNEVTLKKPGRYLVILSEEEAKSSVGKTILYVAAGIVLVPISIFLILLLYYRAQHKKRMKRYAARKKSGKTR